jgi:hypothetical protein
MPSVEAMNKALRIMRNKLIDIEYPSDNNGRTKPNLSFELRASKFVPA